MTFTKIFGALCGALLVFLLINWAAGGIYTDGVNYATGDKQAYTIDTGEEKPAAAKDAGPTFDELFAKADPAKGEKIFSKCKACHKIDGNNAVGPHLNGVVGRQVASVSDFSYSDALKGLGGEWTPDRIQQFIENPKKYAPGTKMGFAGLSKVADRADVIAFLATQK
ncbi:c-type cytochrome [Acidimangrovimonas sediminis]|uniref:c-type cytochrome n=1 Tax=Acidimangrovimonas sediminis TaxID=2056283 RepID=UPI000C7FD189|nr:cytochrome c family protein [Acidimangrovimonas sediminis]